jgi:mono/diheme cytochrome c family protein
MVGLAALSALLSGCGFRLDMHIQPKLKTYRESDFWGDARSARPLVEGTVARGDLRADEYFYTGKLNGQDGTMMPFPVTKEVLQRGQQRFNIYCSPCHNATGDGNGMIVQRGYQKPPSYTKPDLLNAPIGHFYDVISHGYGKMPDYAAQVTPTDRWNIAAYIRVLQLSQHAPANLVPAGTQMLTDAQASAAASQGATTAEQGTEKK